MYQQLLHEHNFFKKQLHDFLHTLEHVKIYVLFLLHLNILIKLIHVLFLEYLKRLKDLKLKIIFNILGKFGFLNHNDFLYGPLNILHGLLIWLKPMVSQLRRKLRREISYRKALDESRRLQKYQRSVQSSTLASISDIIIIC